MIAGSEGLTAVLCISKRGMAAAYSLHALKTLKTLKALPERCYVEGLSAPPRSQNKTYAGARSAEVRASLGGSASPGALTCHPGWPPQQGKVTTSHGSESYDVLEHLKCLYHKAYFAHTTAYTTIHPRRVSTANNYGILEDLARRLLKSQLCGS